MARVAGACAQGVQYKQCHVGRAKLAVPLSVIDYRHQKMRWTQLVGCGLQGCGHRAAEQVADAHCLQVGRLSRLVPLHAAGAGCRNATAILLNVLLTAW
jgi:hypothetical protein